MGKKGVAQISGVVKPIVGETYNYSVTGWYPDTEPEKRNPNNVTWELFKQRSLGKFTTTNIRKKGISSFTFGEKAVGSVYKLQAYLYEPEGGGLIITPQPAKIPKIDKVELFYVDDKKGITFSFMEKLRARAYCVNMLKKELVFTLWEDDAKGEDHNANNKLIETRKAKVNENGIAVTEFMLTKALMKKAMQGETDPKQLEFYVTVEYYSHKKHATDNVNINNPFPPIKHEAPAKPGGVPKAKGSPAASKPASKKEERGIGQIISEKWDELWDWWETPGTIKKDRSPTVQKPDGRSPAIVKGEKKPTSTCICKEQYKDLIWGGKVSCEFRKKVVQICAELWGESRKMEMANGLMAVINVETSGSFKAHQIMGKSLGDVHSITKDDFWLTKSDGTKTSRAIGLIQFTQPALELIGEFTSGSGFEKLHEVKLRFAKMGEINQLNYVKTYIMKQPKYSNSNTSQDIYLLVFGPEGVGKGDDYVLYEKSKDAEKYKQNKSVDEENNNDKKIQRSEILGRYKTSYSQGESNKVTAFSCQSIKKEVRAIAKDIITYHIFSGGKLEKHIPKTIKSGFEKKYKYVYHDKNNKEHELGIFNFKTTTQIAPGNKIGSGEVQLVDVREFTGYNSNGIKLKFKTLNTDSGRYYINPDCYAGLLGAMADINIDYLGFNGFSNYEGKSTGGSKSHRNGEKGDLRYLSKNKMGEATILQDKHFDIPNQNKFNDALFSFGWGRLEKMYSEYFNHNGSGNYLLNHTKHMRKDGKNGYRHYHHLHLSGFDHSFIKIINEK